MPSLLKTTGLPLRIDTMLAPETATVLVALRSRKVWVSTSHLRGPAICRGSLSINEVALRSASIQKKQSRTQSQCEFRERLPFVECNKLDEPATITAMATEVLSDRYHPSRAAIPAGKPLQIVINSEAHKK